LKKNLFKNGLFSCNLHVVDCFGTNIFLLLCLQHSQNGKLFWRKGFRNYFPCPLIEFPCFPRAFESLSLWVLLIFGEILPRNFIKNLCERKNDKSFLFKVWLPFLLSEMLLTCLVFRSLKCTKISGREFFPWNFPILSDGVIV